MQTSEEEYLRSLNHSALEVITVLGADASIRHVSPAIEQMLGYQPEGLVGKRAFDYVHAEDLRAVRSSFAGTLKTSGVLPPIRFRLKAANGSWRHVEVSCSNLLHDPKVGGILASVQDVTERKEVEDKLRESESKYRTLVERIPLVTYTAAPDEVSSRLYVSPQIEQLLGFLPEDFLTDPELFAKQIHPEDRERVLEEIHRNHDSGQPFRSEYRMLRRDGRVVWVYDEAYVLRDEDGKTLGLQGITQDITERKEAEEKIRFQVRLLDAVGEAVIAIDLEGKVVYWNRTAEELYGWSAEEAMGRPSLEVTASEDLWERADEIMSELRAMKSWTGEYQLRRKDGTLFPALIILTPVHDEQGALVGLTSVSTDITERKRAEERLKRSESSLAAAQERAHLGSWEWDISTDELRWSDEHYRIFGHTPQSFTPTYDTHYLNAIHPKDREHVEQAINEAFEGKPYSIDYRIVRPDGKTRHVHSHGEVLFDEGGSKEPVGMAGTTQDITERKRVEEALQESEEWFRGTFHKAGIGMAVSELDGRFVQVNRSLCKMIGYSEEELLATNFQAITHPDDLEPHLDYVRRMLEEEIDSFQMEKRYLHAEGHVVWGSLNASVVRDPEGYPLCLIGQIQDITKRKRTDEALRRSEASLAEAQRMAQLGSWEWDLKSGEVWWSDETYRIYGFEPQQFSPTLETVAEVFHPDDRHLYKATIDGVSHKAKPYDFEHRIVRPDGEVRWLHRRGEVVRGERGEPLRMIGTVHDITEQRALKERLHHQAFHDLLTDLPSRQLFLDRLKQALRHTRRRPGSKVAVLFMDLDNFKVVNDSLGHELGDRLLVAVGERLKGCLRPEDTLARFGGDEFTVLIEDIENPEDAVRAVERIIEALRGPFVLEGQELFLKFSIGIAMGEARKKSPEDLLRDADTAMYRAKEESLQYRIFDPAMYEQAQRRLKLENELRRAIEAEEFVVHYQPIVDLQTEEVRSMEALVRWRHPRRGLLDPEEFVASAEESGLVVPMGKWVLKGACEQAKEWQERHPHMPTLVMAVNLSARQLHRPDLVRTIEGVLRETGLEARCLSLDITETLYIKALKGHTAALDELKRLGVSISIDDFGVGYSSLAYLKRLPADALKIDRAFIAGLGEDVEDTAIVQMIIELAHTLGMKVIAEGVESEGQAEQLKEMGCDLAQGHYFTEPLAAEAVSEFLAR